MVPVALKTFSTWWPEGASLIKSIGENIQDQTEEKPSIFFFNSKYFQGNFCLEMLLPY